MALSAEDLPIPEDRPTPEGRPQPARIHPGAPPCVVVMGVSGVGKTTVGRLLAERSGLPYAEADDFHPAANIAKMAAGHPLDDADRQPWLEQLGGWLHERGAAGTGGVVTCSALKRRYRDTLRAGYPDIFFVHLQGSHDLIADRLGHRTGHFMPAGLLDSQYATLEPLGPDERGIALDVGPTPEELVDAALAQLPWPVDPVGPAGPAEPAEPVRSDDSHDSVDPVDGDLT